MSKTLLTLRSSRLPRVTAGVSAGLLAGLGGAGASCFGAAGAGAAGVGLLLGRLSRLLATDLEAHEVLADKNGVLLVHKELLDNTSLGGVDSNVDLA